MVAATGGVSVALNDGQGRFPSFTMIPAGPGPIAAGDVNGDGFVDIVTGGATVLLGDGKGGVLSRTDYPFDSQVPVYLIDFDGDGLVDIVSASAVGPQDVLFGIGGGNFWGAFLTSDSGTQTVRVTDIDGDGIPDLVAWGGQAGLTAYRGKGNGRFDAIYSNSQFAFVYAVAVGDFNGDGKPDILVTTGNGTITAFVLINNGDGTFQTPVTSAFPNSPASIAAGDFNGDGKLDVAVVTNAYPGITSADSLVVLLGKGDGTFDGGTAYPVNPIPQEVMAADFHGNGHLDLVVSNAFPGGPPLLYAGKGNGTFSAPLPLPLPGSARGLLVADLHRDGRPDLVLEVDVPGPVSTNPEATSFALLGVGGGMFRTAATYPSFFASVAADFNGDGIPDLAGDGALYLGNGDGTFHSVPISLAPAAAADLNRDGKVDLIDSRLTVFLNASRPNPAFSLVSAVSNVYGPVAPESLVTAYGSGLANQNASSVTVTDASGVPRAAPLLYVSPAQINFEIPVGTALGMAEVAIAPAGGALQSVTVSGGGGSSRPVRANWAERGWHRGRTD